MIFISMGFGNAPLQERPVSRQNNTIEETMPFGKGGGSDLAPQYEEGTLIAIVENEEQAREIAELYGIELISVEDGLAIFHTDLDIMALIELGLENDWPPVQPNWIYTAF